MTVARARKIDPSKVVYEAPETLNQAELGERLAAASTPEEALAILADRPVRGEYRVLESEAEVVAGPQGTTVLAPVQGELAVWVDDTPEDREDGAGHFEVYDPERHGEDYNPIFRQGA
jgi:hypothetical protein